MIGSEVWRCLHDALTRGEPAMLLIVTEASGSTAGAPGFKMAVTATGRLAGTIGGGGVEAELVDLARRRLAGPEPRASFERRVHRSDSEHASGQLCGGEQTVWLRPCGRADRPALEALLRMAESGEPGTLAIGEDALRVTPGADARGIAASDPGTAIAAETVPGSAVDPGGDAAAGAAYREVFGPAGRVYLCGGGHVSLALSRVLAALDFHITVLDDRPEVATLAANEWARAKVIVPFGEAGSRIPDGPDVYAIICTPSHRADEEVLRQLAGRPLRYLGMLGSRRKVAEILARLRRDGYTDKALGRLRAPIGVQIGSRTPAEIAVSIAAEMIAVRREPIVPSSSWAS
ncbi:MAG: XdhC family protein [Candidatus Eisenbacteria bacterium]|uniref:XdhC family protein n=1 Tax=Eiseniibacteriota bacterium TaxID=2212470 RepID=A0A937XB17_UNCEI|nr:XdhC family protein [Candidatus Eisenbacteria bacterium]